MAPGRPDVRVLRPGPMAQESGRTRGRGWEFFLQTHLKASRTSSPLSSRLGPPSLPHAAPNGKSFQLSLCSDAEQADLGALETGQLYRVPQR